MNNPHQLSDVNPPHNITSRSDYKCSVTERLKLVYKAAKARQISRVKGGGGYCAEDPIRTIIFLGSWNHT